MLNILKHIKLFGSGFSPGIRPVFFIFNLLFLFYTTAQQNLVPNGSFEEYWECPFENDVGNGAFEKVKYWWKPSMGTSDYFNRCNMGVVGIPTNFWGYQEAYHGDGYVGLVPIGWFTATGKITGQEYIQTKLIRKLAPCYKYHLTFYVSCANLSNYAVGKLSAYFGDKELHEQTDQVLDYTPQIENQQIISDTVNWVKIEGDFIASGNESYLTIGYFRGNMTNDTLFIQSYNASSVAPYYYIDSVSLIEIGEAGECNVMVPNVFTPNQDGINDQIDFAYLNSFKELNFRILNRWGNCVYIYDPNNPVWDGTTMDGELCIDGVYFYIMSSKTKQQTGFIHLIR